MVVEYIAGIKGAIEIAKGLKTATDALGNAQIKLQMAELISALADAKMEAVENSERIAELERQLNTRGNFKFDGHKYYQTLEDGSKDGPYCPTCFDSDEKTVRLRQFDGGQEWNCNVCKNYCL